MILPSWSLYERSMKVEIISAYLDAFIIDGLLRFYKSLGIRGQFVSGRNKIKWQCVEKRGRRKLRREWQSRGNSNV